MHREIERFDAGLPIEEAWTPPKSWYLDPAVLELEARTVFEANWTCAGRADLVGEPGTFLAGSQIDRHHVVVRDRDGVLRAFHNVCRHHAAQLVDGNGTCEELVCPYHGWTYRLDGRLRRAPRVGGIRDFDQDDFRLLPLAVEEWGPLLFLHGRRDPRPLRETIADLDWLNRDAKALRFVARREYHIACNWKVYVDNYLDGGYHVPVLHEGLSAHLDLSSYRTELFERHSVQSCTAKGEARVGTGARYVWIYPNLMLNRYGPILDTNLALPLSADQTCVVFDFYFDEEHAADRDFVERSLAASDRVQEEDRRICESVQRGLGSASYDRGRYAPKVEIGEHHFHRLLAADLCR